MCNPHPNSKLSPILFSRRFAAILAFLLMVVATNLILMADVLRSSSLRHHFSSSFQRKLPEEPARKTESSGGHVTLPVADLSSSIAFYEQLFIRINRPWLPVDGAWFAISGGSLQPDGRDSMHLHLVQDPTTAVSRSKDLLRGVHGVHAAVHVSSFKHAIDRLREIGQAVKLVSPRSDNVDRLWFADPDGHVWEINGPSSRLDALPPAPPAAVRIAPSPNHAKTARGHGGSVASGNPLVTAVAIAVLEQGGTAADAAVAGALASWVVEPHNSGPGGDMSAAVHMQSGAGSSRRAMLNSRGRVPAKHSPSPSELAMMLGHARGPRSVLTIPGGAAGLCSLYVQYGGALPWAALVAPARQLALNGFALSPRTIAAWRQGVHEVVREAGLPSEAQQDFRRRFDIDAQEGDGYVNSELAATLDGLGQGGCEWFYSAGGPVEAALQYASEHGSPLRVAAGQRLQLDKSEYSASWDAEPAVHRLGVKGERYELAFSNENVQAAAAASILEELAGVDVARDDGAQRYLGAHAEATRKTLAAAARAQGGRGPGASEGTDAGDASTRMRRRLQQADREAPPRSIAGGAEGLSVVDDSGLVVALTQSLGGLFGSGVCHPDVGFCLHARGDAFAAAAGGEQAEADALVQRPVDALGPCILRKLGDDGWVLGVAADGGDGARWALTQTLWPLLHAANSSLSDIASHLAHPRFRTSPPSSDGGDAARGGQQRLELEGLAEGHAWGRVGEVAGYEVVPLQNEGFEDAGFGTLHVVGVRRVKGLQTQGAALELFAATDETRKPGKAAVVSAERRREDLSVEERLVAAVLRSMVDSTLAVPAAEPAAVGGKTIITSGEHACDTSAYESAGWDVACITAESTLPTESQLANGVLLGVGDAGRHKAMELSFPVGSVPQMSCTAFQAAVTEEKGAWIEWLRGKGLSEFLPTTVDRDMFVQVLGDVVGGDVERAGVEEATAALELLGLAFPLVLKQPHKTGGSGTAVLKNATALARQLPEMVRRGGPAFIVQEALAGTAEVTVNVAAHYGRILYADAHIFNFDRGLFVKAMDRDATEGWARESGGGGKRLSQQAAAFEEQPEAAKRLVREIVRAARLNGIGCVQYKTFPGAGGELRSKLIEVNARPCKSLLKDEKFPGVVQQWLQYYRTLNQKSSLQSPNFQRRVRRMV